MGITDMIAAFIHESLEQTGGVLELQRSDLAQKFNCVPSQINYVMSTRFSPERSYIVESRRGGGGYIRISRVQVDRKTLVMHVINAIGSQLDEPSAQAIARNLCDSGAISRDAARVLMAATTRRSLQHIPPQLRDTVRADIFKQVLLYEV